MKLTKSCLKSLINECLNEQMIFQPSVISLIFKNTKKQTINAILAGKSEKETNFLKQYVKGPAVELSTEDPSHEGNISRLDFGNRDFNSILNMIRRYARDFKSLVAEKKFTYIDKVATISVYKFSKYYLIIELDEGWGGDEYQAYICKKDNN